jgi:Mce-associated membrane protein
VTAKTAKERDIAAQQSEDIEETEETERSDGGVTEAHRQEPARAAAKKKVRRVRVIEVIDDEEDLDEDLDDVLEAVDAEEKAAAAPARSRASRKSRPDPADDAVTDDDTEVVTADAGTGDGRPAKAERPRPVNMDERGGLVAVFGSPWFTTVLVALVLAAVASWALLRWHTLSAKESERQAVTAAAAKFGDVVYSYDPANVQAAIDANREMMAGDLLSDYTASTNSYKEFFAKNKWTWSSKTSKVYLSDMQGKLASAVIVININIRMTQGPYAVPDAHFTLGMVKQNGAWKVSSLKAAGSETAATAQGSSSGGLPNLSGSQGSGDTKGQKK